MTSGKISVVGSLHYDIMINAPHLPVSDETVIGKEVYFKCGGKGGNQAVAASMHGADVSFSGATGQDYFADILIDNLKSAGVDTADIRQLDTATSGMSVAINETGGTYGAVVASGANLNYDPSAFTVSQNTGLLILQNELPESVNITVAEIARNAGSKVLLNAAPMRTLPDHLLGLVDLLIVNRIEAQTLLGEPIKSVGDAVRILSAPMAFQGTLIVTLGNDGVLLCSKYSAVQHFPAHQVKVLSTHGAGDVFVGALSARLAVGQSIQEAVIYANAAAALHVSTPHEMANSITPEAVREFLAA